MRVPQRVIGAGGAIGAMLVLQLLALYLLVPFDKAGYEAVEDPSNPAYGAIFVVVILVASGFMLLAFKYDLHRIIRGSIIAVAGILTWYVIAALTPASVLLEVGGVLIDPLAPLLALGVVAALTYRPTWYVIDLSAILIGGGAAALFGISFTVFPIILLLVILAAYDAISVYGTKHMLTLAEGAMSMQLPVLLVIPLSREFATTGVQEAMEEHSDDETEPNADIEDAQEMDAIFLGLGDLVIPSILIISAAAQGLGVPLVNFGGLGLGPEVLGAMVGSLLGLLALIGMVFRGSAHAGLPLLNGGVILGYLLGAVTGGIGLQTALGL